MNQHPESTGERVVHVGEVELWTQTYGRPADPAVLLLAGTSNSMDWWRPEFCAALAARGLFVLRYDQRDTGRSTHDQPGSPSYGLPDMVTDAIAVLDAYQLESAHWVGFSSGGWVAQLAALDHPDRVDSLALLSTRPTGHGPADPDLPEVSDQLFAAWASMAEPDWDDPAAVLDYLVDSERTLAAEPFDAAAVRALYEEVLARSIDIRAAITNHPMAEQGPRWRDRLSRITAPTVVISGDRDPLFAPANAEALAAAIPGATLTLLPDVGHELPARRWPDYLSAITTNLARRGAGIRR